jgi:hypothetical protein
MAGQNYDQPPGAAQGLSASRITAEILLPQPERSGPKKKLRPASQKSTSKIPRLHLSPTFS